MGFYEAIFRIFTPGFLVYCLARTSIRLRPKSVHNHRLLVTARCERSTAGISPAGLACEHRGLRMTKGIVKFFNTTKGFGFISPEGGGKDAFVHISAVQQSGLQGLYENDKVEYEVEAGRDGKESAVNLKLLD
jgi:CspA family cold shock protein